MRYHSRALWKWSSIAMRHVFPEHAGQFVKRTGEKVLRTDESVGNDKRAGECVKLGDKRVLLKMPGRLKPASSSHQAKELNDCHNKLPETVENGVKDEEEGSEEGLKRPQSDGGNLLQWGHKKRTRNNNKADAKASAEVTSGGKNPILRPDRRVVRAEKVAAAHAKAPVAPCSQSPLKSTNGGSRRDFRDAEGAGATATARSVDANGVLDSEANTARKADLSSQPPLVNPEKTSGNHANTAGTHATASARPDADGHLEKAAPSGKVDMELFQWPKFIISLSRKEKEDDFFAIKGCKLPIRPKKRLKHVEKTLHFISPGSWLCDLTRERYEVREKKSIKKKPRGLKAMGSADSDSD